MPTPHKTCTKCGDTKPLDEYGKSQASKDGRQAWCRECSREYNRAWHEDNREKVSERKRTYYDANREKVREQQRTYHHENRDFRNRCSLQRGKGMNALTHLTATRNGQPWEQWEDNFIVNHPEMTYYQLATHLGRTHDSIRDRKARLRRKGVLAQ